MRSQYREKDKLMNNKHKVEAMKHEWSYPLEVEKITSKPTRLEAIAGEEERAALCRRLDIPVISRLEAKLVIQRNAGNMIIHIKGEIDADVEQRCIVTREPVKEKVRDSFEAWYADPGQAVSFTKARRERMNIKDKGEQPMLEECDDPEPIVNGVIDLGELVTQNFSLALNPYPRKKGAAYKGGEEESLAPESPEGAYNNPFAALKEWRAKESKDEH